MIELKLLSGFDAISKQEWNALVQKSHSNSPFLLHGYLKNWWTHKGGGEWAESELVLISGHLDGQLIGIAPFFSAIHEGEKKILLLGSIEISDYLDFIYEPEYGSEFITQTLAFLAEEESTSFERLLLVNLPESSPTLNYLKEACKKNNWKLDSERAYHTPAIHLADTWDAYLAGIAKKQRHEIRRKMRRAAESPQNVSWYTVNNQENLKVEIESFFDLMITDPDKKRFLTDAMRAQMQAIIQWAFDEELLQLSFLTVDDQKAAAYLCFDYLDRIWVYNSGFDPSFREYSPGWVMLSYLIQNAIENGKNVFDFMRGDEAYKYRFGAEDGFVLKVEINR